MMSSDIATPVSTTGAGAVNPKGFCGDLSDREAARLGREACALYESLGDHLAAGLMTLPDKPEEGVAETLRSLWHLAGGLRLSAVAAQSRDLAPLDDIQVGLLFDLIARRMAGEPLAHLTERQHFLGLEMLAGPAALIPRRETELLGGAAAKLLADLVAQRGRPCVVDVCTGCGNIALALAYKQPAARIYAADLSPEAVELAHRNGEFLGLSNRVELRTGDLLAPFESDEFLGQVDLLTCNPPYISTGRLASMPGEIIDREPKLAFDGGPLGVRVLQRLLREAPRFLRPGGWLAFEVGLGQGPSVRKRMEASGSYGNVEHVVDGNGDIRVLLGRTPAPNYASECGETAAPESGR